MKYSYTEYYRGIALLLLSKRLYSIIESKINMKREENLNIEKLLTELKENLKKYFGEKLQKCVLFGSYSDRTESDDSDVDVLVLLNLPKDQIEKHQYRLDEITLELSLKYDVVISLLTKNSEEFYQYSDVIPLYQNIVKEGKEIYG